MEALCDDVESVCLVKECRKLEESIGMRFTDSVFLTRCVDEGGDEGGDLSSRQAEECGQPDIGRRFPIKSEVVSRIGWARLWDAALDLGAKAVKGLQFLSRIMSHHGRGS